MAASRVVGAASVVVEGQAVTGWRVYGRRWSDPTLTEWVDGGPVRRPSASSTMTECVSCGGPVCEAEWMVNGGIVRCHSLVLRELEIQAAEAKT